MGSTISFLNRVQAWFATDKLEVTMVDPNLLAICTEQIFNRLSSFVTTGWLNAEGGIDQDLTPALVQQAISLLYASVYYDRTYAETSTEDKPAYGLKLEQMCEALIHGMQSGYIEVPDANQVVWSPPEQPVSHMSDITSAGPVYDANGDLRGWMGSNDIKFRMSMRP